MKEKVAFERFGEPMSFLIPIKSAILIFPVLAILLSLPFLIVQYHRYGGIIAWRSIVIFTFIFYLLCAYFLIILPLPSIQEVRHLTTQRYNLIPFTALREFISTTYFNLMRPQTWIPAVKQPGFIQPFFNIILTIPFGVYLRYYFKQPIRKIILYGFGLSLFFELTQLSGLYGIYPRPYRLFDVDDLILNTSGAFVGGLITPFLVKAFPTREQIDRRSYDQGRKVTVLRRLVALIFDYLVVGTIVGIFLSLVGLDKLTENAYFSYFISTLIIFIIIPVLTGGQTIGKKVVKIRITQKSGKPVGIGQLIWRQLLIYDGALPILWGFNYMFVEVFSKMHQSQINIFLLGMLGLLTVFLGLNFIWGIGFKHGYFFYDSWANTTQISEIKQPQG
ncbi:VanZ family protein [Pediococcus pentosaceus]